MKRFRCAVILVLLLIAILPVTANAAAATPIDDFTHTLTGPGTVLLTKYVGKSNAVTVPSRYLVNGVTCQVLLDSRTVFAGNTTITSVTVSSGVAFKDNTMNLLFAKCTAMQNVKLQADTASVTDMSYLFYGCESLEKLNVSSFNTANVITMKGMFSHCGALKKLTGYEKWNTQSLQSIAYMFNQTAKLQTIDISHWNLEKLENSAWCFQNCGASKIVLPNNLPIMSAGFLNHATAYAGTSFTVPAGVKKIGYAHTIYDFATESFKEFRIAEGNTSYKALDGILYSADGTEMLAIPRGKTFKNGIYEIPEGVTFLGELSFSRNYNIKTVVLPDSYILKYVPLNAPEYITKDDTGNLNAGLNLNIAIYSFTGVRSYAVKDSNPNYISIGGVLYTKDGMSLVAVPTRYEADLRIPEGVVTWQSAAMWNVGEPIDDLMKNCTGVYIPASMTEIARDQLEKLNRLESRNANFRITVSEDNPVYYTGKSGQLLKKPNLADLQITLSQDVFVYDGQPKTPEPTIVHKGKTLKQGKDYILDYSENVNAGTAWVRMTGQGAFYGTLEHSFTIEKATPAYTAPDNLTATYAQTLGEITLPEGYAWADPNLALLEMGTHSFDVTYTNGDSNYLPVTQIPVTLQVQPRQVGSESICVAWWYPWTGRAVKPEISVIDATGIIDPTEYSVTYENNFDVGKGNVILRDNPGGCYTVNGEAEYYIVPGPALCIAALTLLWCFTTGTALSMRTEGAPRLKQPKNR